MKSDKPIILVTNDYGITSPGIRALIEMMRLIGEVVVVILLCSVPLLSYSQGKTTPDIAYGTKPKFERISLEQGLSQLTVYCIFRDSRGFMWFGTQDGLNRYDGYEFTHFKNDPNNPHSISHNRIWSI